MPTAASEDFPSTPSEPITSLCNQDSPTTKASEGCLVTASEPSTSLCGHESHTEISGAVGDSTSVFHEIKDSELSDQPQVCNSDVIGGAATSATESKGTCSHKEVEAAQNIVAAVQDEQTKFLGHGQCGQMCFTDLCVSTDLKQQGHVNPQTLKSRQAHEEAVESAMHSISSLTSPLQPQRDNTVTLGCFESTPSMREFCLCPLTRCIMEDPVTAEVSSKCLCWSFSSFLSKALLIS